MNTSPQRLRGNWEEGWTLDWFRVPPSRSPGVPIADAPRTRLGDLIFRLKASLEQDAIAPLAANAAGFLAHRDFLRTVEAIVPVPNRREGRPFQPTTELVYRIAEQLRLPAQVDYLKLTAHDAERQTTEFQIANDSFAGKSLLVVDDVYLTGKTLKSAVEAVYSQGRAKHVYVLAIVRKRRKKKVRPSTPLIQRPEPADKPRHILV